MPDSIWRVNVKDPGFGPDFGTDLARESMQEDAQQRARGHRIPRIGVTAR